VRYAQGSKNESRRRTLTHADMSGKQNLILLLYHACRLPGKQAAHAAIRQLPAGSRAWGAWAWCYL